MKESKPLVVRYCPYKSLPYHRRSKRDELRSLTKKESQSLSWNHPYSIPTNFISKPAEVSTPNVDVMVRDTLEAISTLYPPLNSTRVHWDLSAKTKQSRSAARAPEHAKMSSEQHLLHNVTLVTSPKQHPLHNVTLVTSPDSDDLSDVLEELEDLWTALHKTTGSFSGTLNEE